MTFPIMLAVMLPFMLMILPYIQLGSNLCQGLDLGPELRVRDDLLVSKLALLI